MKIQLMLLILIIIINYNTYSIIDEINSSEISEIVYSLQNSSSEFTQELNIDNQEISNTEQNDSVLYKKPLRVDPIDFMYADNQRYTIDGNMPLLETDIDYLRFGIFAGAFTGFMVYQHIYQVNTIWSERGTFRIMEDGDYALYSDKIGHFYGAYFSGYTYSELLMWSGFSKETATLTGALMGLAYSTYVEVMDGFAEQWGFSPSDFYSDAAGFGFLLLQNYVPWFQNITPKFQYIPSEWHGDKRRSPSEFFIDDYSSQSLYFSFNVYNMLPENLQQYWLPWLQITVGYAARNLCNPTDPNSNCDYSYSTRYSDLVAGSPRFIIGLDYDLVKLLPDGIPLWNWIRQSLNYIKFPAPAIEISERGTRFMLMYPFLAL
ncbi:MAG: DUF2279 domain-containing protein [Candidatus Kapabacteria bacterium]|nr:DUF2279 domain-containing protein [Ignavibacteriota bacterium]MCW5884369.1 DUF2279 domain-containing protein [Candidatus Kapabacteria bacterium]